MFSLAWKNIIRRLGGSLMTALIAFIAVFVLATSLAVVASLENGLRLSRERLGADIMVLPAGASGNASEVLFCAEPVNVYLPADVERTVAETAGVEQATPQFFTQTVNQSCCSVIGVTRVVGIDMETDFIVGPWLVGGALEGGALPPDGIILGAAAPPIEGGQASILGSVFHCVGTLEPTGSSVDETIFMDVNAARTIAAESPYLESVWLNVDPFDAISCVMVKVKEGAQPSAGSCHYRTGAGRCSGMHLRSYCQRNIPTGRVGINDPCVSGGHCAFGGSGVGGAVLVARVESYGRARPAEDDGSWPP